MAPTLASAASQEAAWLLPCAAEQWHLRARGWCGGTQLQPGPGAGVSVERELRTREQQPQKPGGSTGGLSPAPGQGGKPPDISDPLRCWGKANPSFHAPWSKEAVTDSSYQRAERHHPGHGHCSSGTPLSLCGSADGCSRCWSSGTGHVKEGSLSLCC